jgi:adenosylhomocysteine nucleosidase
VVADKVLRPQQTEDFNFDEKTPAREIILDTALVNKALLLSCPKEATAHCGTLMTIDRIAGKPEDKKNLGENYSVLAVDMETFELAELTHKKDLPFLSIRAVSDTVNEELFDATDFVEEDGEVSTLKAGWYVLKNPGSLKDLMDLRQRSQLATSNLTRFLSQFLRNFK